MGMGRFELHTYAGLFRDDEVLTAADIHADGSFTLTANEPGNYELRLALAFEDGEETWDVVDTVALAAGVNPWKLELSTGSLRVLPVDANRPLWTWNAPLVWDGGPEITVNAPQLEEPRGTRLYERVPVGRSSLLHAERLRLACVIRPGETTELRLP